MTTTPDDEKIRLEELSSQDFQSFGLNQIVYIKPVETDDGEDGYAIHAADGTTLSVMSSLDSALHLARHNNLYPFTIH